MPNLYSIRMQMANSQVLMDNGRI